MVLRTHQNLQDFSKDIVTFLTNVSQEIDLPGKEEAMCILQFLLSFAPSPAPNSAEEGNNIRFLCPSDPSLLSARSGQSGKIACTRRSESKLLQINICGRCCIDTTLRLTDSRFRPSHSCNARVYEQASCWPPQNPCSISSTRPTGGRDTCQSDTSIRARTCAVVACVSGRLCYESSQDCSRPR